MLALRNTKYPILKIIWQVFMMDGAVLGNRPPNFSFPSLFIVPDLSMFSWDVRDLSRDSCRLCCSEHFLKHYYLYLICPENS